MNVKYAILGAGPAGLVFSNALLKGGEKDFVVLEKEKTAGGLCRSTQVDGSPFDIGGGHFLDVKNQKVLSFIFDFMREDEWEAFDRKSRICMPDGDIIDSPIEANIWQFNDSKQKEYIASILDAGCNKDEEKPSLFVDWIKWKLGKKIADDYMIPYNTKMFGENLDSLGTYWLDKLPNVSIEDTIKSCNEHKAYGKQPGHARFLYPRNFGYGEVWERMADNLGARIIYDYSVETIDADNRVINDEIKADYIISTIPWDTVTISSDAKDILKEMVCELKHTSIVTEYYSDNIENDAHWIYYPDTSLDYHRILVRHNFCKGSKGYWTETNIDRYDFNKGNRFFVNEYAYPLNTVNKNEVIKRVQDTLGEFNIIGLGRWGEWQHFNSDVVVDRAIRLADDFLGK